MKGEKYVGNKPLLCSLCLVPTIVAMMGLKFSQSNLFIYSFPIAFAITMAKAPLGWSLIGDFFGRKSYATLRGIMGLSYGTATFFSPIFAGWIFDNTGSYDRVLTTFSVILLVVICLFTLLRSPALNPYTQVGVRK